MAGNGWKWLEMAGFCWNGLKWLKWSDMTGMVGNDWKCVEMA